MITWRLTGQNYKTKIRLQKVEQSDDFDKMD
jgi:hypothetical protein